MFFVFFFLNDKATTEIYTYGHTLSLRDARPSLDRMGLAGGLLTAIRSVAHSRTTDPVTGQRRPVSSTPSSASLSARQDLGQGSWGAMLTGGLESTFYG